MSDSRRQVHELIDRMPQAQVSALVGLLETIVDRDVAEERAVDEAKQWLRDNGGKGISHEEVLADLGLTLEDFQQMGEERAQRRS